MLIWKTLKPRIVLVWGWRVLAGAATPRVVPYAAMAKVPLASLARAGTEMPRVDRAG